MDISNPGTKLGIADVEAMTGISAFTIRYYDKCGFFPNLERSKRGVRSFAADDVSRLRLIETLRRSGLSIEGIGYYVRLETSPGTIDERLRILKQQVSKLEIQRDEIARDISWLDDVIASMESGNGHGFRG